MKTRKMKSTKCKRPSCRPKKQSYKANGQKKQSFEEWIKGLISGK